MFHGFNVTDNLAIGPNDVTEFYVTTPQDSRLPGGGGYQVADSTTSTRMSSVRPTTSLPRRRSYGNQYVFFNGVDFNANARLSQLTCRAASTGRTTSDSCEVRAKVPETALLDPHCHVVSGYLPYYKGLATYNVPKIDVQLGVTFLSKPGMVVSFAGTLTNGGHLRQPRCPTPPSRRSSVVHFRQPQTPP